MDSHGLMLLSHDDLAEEVSRLRTVVKSLGASETARRRIKDQLLQERNILRSLFDLSPHPIIWLDVKGRFLRANQAALAALVPAQPSAEHSLLSDPQFAALGLKQVFAKVLTGDIMRLPRHRFNPSRTHPGAPNVDLYLETVLYPVEDASGVVHSVLLMHVDVTELARAESTVRELRASLARREPLKTGNPRRGKGLEKSPSPYA